ncbi:MAG TPA: alkaline phosphatase family protein [Solirubrobacteraceae bacterium]|nr:alkaline phosphatase family protein [Solirubrobacteraceae bacterium]
MREETQLTRRTVLRSAAGLAAGGALTRALPAWARPVAQLTALRKPDSRPFPHLPAGHESLPEIRHVVVLMLENHSFDNLLGSLRGVDGLSGHDWNPDAGGNRVYATHAPSPCQLDKVPSQSWNASHQSYDGGRNDGFVLASGPTAMWFWNKSDLPFTYALAKHFPVGERYFCSVLAQTYPNRRFLFTGTASGTIATDNTTFAISAANGTIFDRMDAHRISYRGYFENLPSWFILPNVLRNPAQTHRALHISRFYADAAAGRLPQVSILDPDYNTTSEENPQDIQVGERFVASVCHALMRSPNWKNTALFLTYDEHGGYYDHVPPPRAIKPDSIAPRTASGDAPGAYDRYGFRVPLIVVSPWARARHVSRVVQDHTSILAFIERKWNLPAMTWRDANADPMLDYFDFRAPAFAKPPRLPAAPALAPGLAQCTAAGLTPPL